MQLRIQHGRKPYLTRSEPDRQPFGVTTTRMTKNFFSQALRDAMSDRHFNQAQLAEFLKVDPAYISRWLKGSSPRLHQMREVLSHLGWDIDRARPDYDPFSDAITRVDSEKGAAGSKKKVAEKTAAYRKMDAGEVKKLLEGAAETHRIATAAPVPLVGTVAAENAQVTVGKDASATYDTIGTMFPEVDFAENTLSFLRVEGKNLEPLYRDGDLLAVRRVLQPSKAPDGSVVVFETGKRGSTGHLRRMIRVADRSVSRVERLIGIPLVDGQDYLFFKPREAKLAYVVVGVLSVRV